MCVFVYTLQVPGAGPVPVRRPVHVGPLAGGADGVAEAIRLAPHPPQAAAGEQALHRELYGDAHREVDELALTRESGECRGSPTQSTGSAEETVL